MSDPYDTYWDAVAFLRTWKAPFATGVEALRKAEGEAGQLRKTAEAVLGAPLPAEPALDAGSDPLPHLEALRARVADAQRFAEVATLRETVEEWLGRATPEGPLASWAADARGRLAELDPRIATATTGGLGAAKEQLDVLVRAIEEKRRGLLDKVDANRAAATSATAAYEEACELVQTDLRSMQAGLGGLVRAREDELRRGLVALAVAGAGGGVAGMAVAYARGAGRGLPVAYIGIGLIAGLGLGLTLIVTRYAKRTRRVGELAVEARTLREDAAQAQAEVRAEILTLQEAADHLGRDAKELRAAVTIPDHGPLLDAVATPADAGALDAYILRAEEASRPDLLTLGVMAGVLALMVGLGVGVARAPAPEPAPLPYAATDRASPLVATDPPPTAPSEAAPPADPGPPPPTGTARSSAPVPDATPAPAASAFTSGEWEGTLGTARMAGTLTASGTSVRGSLTLSGLDGDQTCSVRGTLSGTKLALSGSGCAAKISLSGSVRDDGRTASGTGRSTIEFQGRAQTASDSWEMRAR